MSMEQTRKKLELVRMSLYLAKWIARTQKLLILAASHVLIYLKYLFSEEAFFTLCFVNRFVLKFSLQFKNLVSLPIH